METKKIDPLIGSSFEKVAKDAVNIAADENCIVEFDFNDVLCKVTATTVTKNLWRDFQNSWLMEWKTIGPDCVTEYAPAVQMEINARQIAQDEKDRLQREQWAKDDAENQRRVLAMVDGIEFAIASGQEAIWKNHVEVNSKDGYSKAVIDYGDMWARMMQKEISAGKTVSECADYTQKPLSFIGITGFQYGAVVNGLGQCWKHGEELRQWHNAKYGVSADKKGTVNPAILTIKTD